MDTREWIAIVGSVVSLFTSAICAELTYFGLAFFFNGFATMLYTAYLFLVRDKK